MDLKEKLLAICNLYQKTLEENTMNFPTGTCYLSAYCLTEYFNKNGFNAILKVGELALVNIKDKYVIYGKELKLKKSVNVGDYHAWCELNIEDKCYIIDPSIKYNNTFLKKEYNFKVSKKISDIIITAEKSTFYWKYKENKSLFNHYNHFISIAPEILITKIIDELNKSHTSIE